MKKTNGKVIEVYIPEQYKNENLIDIMDRAMIGFNVQKDDGTILSLEFEQDDENANIMKDDIVEIIEQEISGKKFIDISLYEGDSYE